MLTGAFLLLGACRSEADQTATAAPLVPLVETARVSYQYWVQPVQRIGRLVPAQELKLSFKTGGIIEQIRVSEGQTVRKGQALAKLKETELQALVQQGEVLLAQQEKEMARLSRLYADTVITLDQLEKAQSALAQTQSRLDAAQFNLQSASLFAPYPARVLRRLAEPGELIGPGTPVVLLAPLNQPWHFRVQLADQEGTRVQIGDSAHVQFDAFPERVFRAQVINIDPMSDPLLGTISVELQFIASESNWVAGLIGQAAIFPRDGRPWWMLPADALVEAQESRGYVYQVEADTLKRVEIQIAHITPQGLAIRAGIADSIEVVVSGLNRLREGLMVRRQ